MMTNGRHLWAGVITSVLLLLLALCGWQYAFMKTVSAKPASAKAMTQPPAPTSPIRGVPSDTWADIVLGQPNGFGEMSPNEVTGSRVFNPGGVIVDRSVFPNRMYVYDSGNSRVVGLTLCHGSTATCQAWNGRRAEIVLGQPGLDGYGACNREGNFQNYPTREPASTSTLCGLHTDQVSPLEGGSGANMAVDSQGNLYVPDFFNHRVLLYLKPFETDTVADDVWGQNDFSGNECNMGRGINAADNKSLCYRSPFNEGFVGGVGIDSGNNLWVTDNQNNRVLRFPFDPNTGRASHTANLVLGQANFTSGNHGNGLNQLFAPAAVRVNSGGSVFVADSLNNRVLIYDAPFSNGMNATRVLASNLRTPTALEFDLSGNLWVSDSDNHQLLRFNPAGQVDRVLFKDIPNYTGMCGGNYTGDGPLVFFPATNSFVDTSNLCASIGSMGIDSDGNVWASDRAAAQDVWRFPAPFPAPTPGISHSADILLFKPHFLGEANSLTKKGFFSPRGIATAGGQLIVADSGRLMFWNNAPASLSNGKPADGIVGASNDFTLNPHNFGRIKADSQNHLWVIHTDLNNTIEVYNLPLVTSATPFQFLPHAFPLLGGGTITLGNDISIAGLAPTPDGSSLWLSDPENSRVIRIRNPLSSPVVDIILGQTNATATQCNQGGAPGQTTLCYPGSVDLDPNGNLFVADDSLEVRGNYRLLEYDTNLFPASPSSPLFAAPASRVYLTGGSFTSGCVDNLTYKCGPFQPAITAQGRMIVGFNAYVGARFPAIYDDVLGSGQFVGFLNDYFSMAYATHYDSAGNLYVADLNRSRVLVYLNGVCPTLNLSPTSLPNSTVGANYNQMLTATGGTAPYSFSVTAGILPNGLSLNANTGMITGTPTIQNIFNFTVAATDANQCSSTRVYTVVISGTGLQFYPLAQPVRLLDTRAGQPGCSSPSSPIASNTTITQTARNFCGIPAQAQAVTGNVTVVSPGANGFLTIYPSNTTRPTVANTNFIAGDVLNNVFTVGLGSADGAMKIFASSTTEVVIDVTGYYAPPGTGGLYFHPLPKPIRLLDTRAGQTACFTPAMPLPGNADSLQQGTTTCDGVTIPSTAQALVGNATTVVPSANGFITLYPADAMSRPLAASGNYRAGTTLNSPFTVGLSPSRQFKIYTVATTDLVIDVLGYFSADATDINGTGLLFTPLTPQRLLDTRIGQTACFAPSTPLIGGMETSQPARGVCTIDNTALALVGNVTTVQPSANGFLTFWPSNAATRPLAATSNYQSGRNFNRYFSVGLGTDGAFKMYAASTTDLVIDVSGYFAP